MRVPVRPGIEVLLVLGVSLGRSAVYAMLDMADLLTRGAPLASQTSSLNPTLIADRPWLDALYQIAGTVFPVVPALLAVYLVSLTSTHPWQALGLELGRHTRTDLLGGLGLAALIGIPGLGLYLAARAAGLNTQVEASGLGAGAWAVIILGARAAMNGFLEEVVVVGYLFDRLPRLGWTPLAVLACSALLRGSYHLYQGWGGFAGNIVMGLVFGAVYLRFRRVMPLVVAHTAIDVAAFVGYAALAPRVGWL